MTAERVRNQLGGRPTRRMGQKRRNPGDGLFSRKAALSVSSALESLTSVFGMGTGVASPLESPGFHACGSCVGSGSARARMRGGRRNKIFNFASFGRLGRPRVSRSTTLALGQRWKGQALDH